MRRGSSLVLHAKKRTESVKEAIRCAKETIAREVEQHGGVYPFNGGRLSEAEFCRRAGISQITLLGKTHKSSTKVELARWLLGVTTGLSRGKRSVRKAVTLQVEAWKDRHDQIANHYHLAELEMIALREKVVALQTQTEEQQAIIARLRTELSAGHVVKFPS